MGFTNPLAIISMILVWVILETTRFTHSDHMLFQSFALFFFVSLGLPINKVSIGLVETINSFLLVA